MQGKRKGVATQIRMEAPPALPMHYFTHSLNLCLQDAGRKSATLRNGLDIVKEIAQSPKGFQENSGGISIKPLCVTRWTARTHAIEAVLKYYFIFNGCNGRDTLLYS